MTWPVGRSRTGWRGCRCDPTWRGRSGRPAAAGPGDRPGSEVVPGRTRVPAVRGLRAGHDREAAAADPELRGVTRRRQLGHLPGGGMDFGELAEDGLPCASWSGGGGDRAPGPGGDRSGTCPDFHNPAVNGKGWAGRDWHRSRELYRGREYDGTDPARVGGVREASTRQVDGTPVGMAEIRLKQVALFGDRGVPGLKRYHCHFAPISASRPSEVAIRTSPTACVVCEWVGRVSGDIVWRRSLPRNCGVGDAQQTAPSGRFAGRPVRRSGSLARQGFLRVGVAVASRFSRFASSRIRDAAGRTWSGGGSQTAADPRTGGGSRGGRADPVVVTNSGADRGETRRTRPRARVRTPPRSGHASRFGTAGPVAMLSVRTCCPFEALRPVRRSPSRPCRGSPAVRQIRTRRSAARYGWLPESQLRLAGSGRGGQRLTWPVSAWA